MTSFGSWMVAQRKIPTIPLPLHCLKCKRSRNIENKRPNKNFQAYTNVPCKYLHSYTICQIKWALKIIFKNHAKKRVFFYNDWEFRSLQSWNQPNKCIKEKLVKYEGETHKYIIFSSLTRSNWWVKRKIGKNIGRPIYILL